MRRWFSSDFHWFHQNIIRFTDRPFTDVRHMNTAIIDHVNEHVGPGDQLWLLGDIAMGSMDDSLALRSRLVAGEVFLVPGNHDKCHPAMKKAEQWRARYEDAGFIVTDPSFTLTLGETDDVAVAVNVSHFPYADPVFARSRDAGREDRYADWRPVDDGKWLLAGHVHETFQTRGRVLNVGIDAWAGRILSEQDVLDVVAGGPLDRPADRWVAPTR